MPLYRYHLRLRLARALDLLADADDLTDLAFGLGFASHSPFHCRISKGLWRDAVGVPALDPGCLNFLTAPRRCTAVASRA